MKCECSLKEFVKKYPYYKVPFSNLLSDPLYIVKFKLDKKGEFEYIEVGYKSDFFLFENISND